MSLRRSTLMAAWLLALPFARAEEPSEATEVEYATVVTGSRSERRVSEAPVTTEVIDRKEIRTSTGDPVTWKLAR